MADPFIAEIKIFAGNFAPRGWAFCNGQLLQIAQNTALFSLIGTFYGGDGRTTMGLPNLQGRAPIHFGGNSTGPGLTRRNLGSKGGVGTVTLTQQTMPNHRHDLSASNQRAELNSPASNRTIARAGGAAYQTDTSSNLVNFAPQAMPNAGGGGPHNNMQPYLGMYFIIALTGQYPSRS